MHAICVQGKTQSLNNTNMADILQTIERYRALGIDQQIDYKKFYLYSIITHSTAIEGSTVTEIENQLLFDEGITAPGRTLQEQMMNLDLKAAYEEAQRLADRHTPYSIDMLCRLSAIVMKNTGSTYNTPLGSFSAAEGELRKVNVTAGFGGRSYLAHEKVPQALSDFCRWLNTERAALPKNDILAAYRLSFVAHFRLVSIHPWADGNGRMSRLVMNMLQFEFGLIPTKVLKEQKAEYIQALNDTRDQQDESIFPSVMMRLHNTNLQSEIDAFVASQETDAKTIGKPVGKTIGKKLGKTAGKIVELMRNNPQITIPEIAVVVQTSESNVLQHTSIAQIENCYPRSSFFYLLCICFLQFHADFVQYAKIICISQFFCVSLHAILRANHNRT